MNTSLDGASGARHSTPMAPLTCGTGTGTPWGTAGAPPAQHSTFRARNRWTLGQHESLPASCHPLRPFPTPRAAAAGLVLLHNPSP